MDKTFLEQLKNYLLEMDQKRKFGRLQSNLRYAIENLDIETTKELLQNGASIEQLEETESMIGLAASTYDFQLYNIVSKYCKQRHIKMHQYFNQILRLGKDDLDPELNAKMEEETKNLLEMSELLYQNGANINHNTYLGYKEQGMLRDIISEQRQLKKVPTVFERMGAGIFTFSKDISVLEWVASKPDFNIKRLQDGNVVARLIHMECPESVQALQILLERGLHLEDYEVFGNRYNALIDCLAYQNLTNRQEKFNLVWQMATEEQRDYVTKTFDLGNIEIPVGFGENTSGTSYK